MCKNMVLQDTDQEVPECLWVKPLPTIAEMQNADDCQTPVVVEIRDKVDANSTLPTIIEAPEDTIDTKSIFTHYCRSTRGYNRYKIHFTHNCRSTRGYNRYGIKSFKSCWNRARRKLSVKQTNKYGLWYTRGLHNARIWIWVCFFSKQE